MTDAGPETMARVVGFIRTEHSERVQELAAGAYDEPTLHISLTELDRQLPDVFDDLTAHPEIVGEWFDTAANNIEELSEQFFNSEEIPFRLGLVKHDVPQGGEEIAVTFTDPPSHMKEPIGAPRGDFFGSLIAYEGICQQRSDPKPRLLEAVFRCQRCNNEEMVDCSATFDLDNVQPGECAGCERQGPWERVPEKDVREEYQQLKLQERPEQARNSSNPREILCDAQGGHLVDEAAPGDRVTVVGVVREKVDNDSTLQDPRLEVHGIATEEQQFEEIELDDDDLERIHEIAERPDLFDTLRRSVAPGIYGYDDEKLGIAMQLFGGVTTHHYETRKRGQIHIMYIGDPGTGKSKLLHYAREIAPRGVAASGTASTAVGLTASATREKIGQEEQWTLSAGAAALADQGLLTVDEFDKFDEQEQRSLNEALSEGEMTVNKANIRTTVRSRCSALIAANPEKGRFDQFEQFAEQFDMPPDLLNRCDLVFTFTDEPDEATDRQVAEKVLEAHSDPDAATADGGRATVAVDENGVIPPEMFRKYVAYARRNFSPQLTADARDELQDFYESVRSDLSHDGKIPMNPRQLEAGRRLTQAFARASLSEEATVEHAKEAEALLNSYLADIGFDVDKLENPGKHASQKQLTDELVETVKAYSDEEAGAPVGKVLGRMGEEGYDQGRVESEIESLKNKGRIYAPESDRLRMT